MTLPLPRTARPPRPAAGLVLASLTALTGLAACTSDDGGTEGEADGAQQTLEGDIPESDWWCRLIERPLVEAVAGDRTDQAREVLRQNDVDGFRCEVVLPEEEGSTETETLLTLAVAIDDEARAEELRAVAEQERARPGPEHLGESYTWPGGVVSIVPCQAPPGHERAGEQVTYVFSLLAEEPVDMADEMEDPVRQTLVEADQAVGCSPSQARERQEEG